MIALGGNALIPPGGRGTAEEQTRTVASAMSRLAPLAAAGAQLVITHGNGPQVGNLLLKNELAADVVPPMPLDWCVVQARPPSAWPSRPRWNGSCAASPSCAAWSSC